MFTIKHIHMDGSEDLVPVDSVRFSPPSTQTIHDNGIPPTVWGNEKPYTGGTIFVMNTLGKTVARYDLGASPIPAIGSDEDHRPRGLYKTGQILGQNQ